MEMMQGACICVPTKNRPEMGKYTKPNDTDCGFAESVAGIDDMLKQMRFQHRYMLFES